MLEPHTPLFVGKTHLALDLLEKKYKNYFNFIIIICPMLKHNSTYRSRKWVWTDPEVTLIEPGNSLYGWIANETLGKRRQPLLDSAISGRHKEHLLWLLTQS